MVSAVKGTTPAFPSGTAAGHAPAQPATAIKSLPAAKSKSVKSAAKPATAPAAKSAGLPPGFCWLMPMTGKKFPAKILKYDGDLVYYETPEGKKQQANRNELAIICP